MRDWLSLFVVRGEARRFVDAANVALTDDDHRAAVEALLSAVRLYEQFLAQADARHAEDQTTIAELREQLRPGSLTERAPTTWAYEQVCKALAAMRRERDEALARLAETDALIHDFPLALSGRVITEACERHRSRPKPEGGQT